MITTELVNVLTDFAGVFTSWVFASILFSTGIHFRRLGWTYHYLLLALGIGTSIDLVLDATYLILELQGTDTEFMELFIRPVCVFTQSIIVFLAIQKILNISMMQLRKMTLMIMLMMLLVLVYPFLYSYTVWGEEEFWSIASYMEFTDTAIAKFITYAIIIVMIAYTAMAAVNIVKGFRYFCDVLCMYFSIDLGPILKRSIAWLVLGVLYTVFSELNLVVHTDWMKPVHYVSVTFVFMCMVILILCNHERLERIEQAYRYIKRAHVEVIPGSGDGIVIAQREEPQPEDVQRIRAIMEQWANRPDRPFMEHGITLQSVSDDMGLPTGIIQKYSHTIYSMSFREWILDLRKWR